MKIHLMYTDTTWKRCHSIKPIDVFMAQMVLDESNPKKTYVTEKTVEITLRVKVPNSFDSNDESQLDEILSDAIDSAGYTCLESLEYKNCKEME